MTPTDRDTSPTLRQAVHRLNARAWGISFGLLGGLGLFGATLFLILKGGENVGQHLHPSLVAQLREPGTQPA
mgnify:CR=1 FL=1